MLEALVGITQHPEGQSSKGITNHPRILAVAEGQHPMLFRVVERYGGFERGEGRRELPEIEERNPAALCATSKSTGSCACWASAKS